MKKIVNVLFVLCVVLAVAGCASKPPASGGMPEKIADARRNAPEDVLVGVGTAKLGTVNQSRTMAQTRARAEISNQLSSIVRNMVRDYTASSEVDPQAALAYQENITVTLSKSNLTGAAVYVEEPTNDGNWWCAMYLNKANAAIEINQAMSHAQAQARLNVPFMASQDAQRRMDEAFEQLKKEEGY